MSEYIADISSLKNKRNPSEIFFSKYAFKKGKSSSEILAYFNSVLVEQWEGEKDLVICDRLRKPFAKPEASSEYFSQRRISRLLFQQKIMQLAKQPCASSSNCC